MKKIFEVLLLAILAISLGVTMGGMGTALAGTFTIADGEGQLLEFATLSTVNNTPAKCKKDSAGVTREMLVSLTNSGAGTVDIWVQHGLTELGAFANVIATAFSYDPSADAFYFESNVKLFQCVRIHTEDSDITTNNVTAEVWAW